MVSVAIERAATAADQGFAFAFVEGELVRALREGHWLLLDEVNLAPPEVLERLAPSSADDRAAHNTRFGLDSDLIGDPGSQFTNLETKVADLNHSFFAFRFTWFFTSLSTNTGHRVLTRHLLEDNRQIDSFAISQNFDRVRLVDSQSLDNPLQTARTTDRFSVE